jgi:uncharacterized protein YkwD
MRGTVFSMPKARTSHRPEIVWTLFLSLLLTFFAVRFGVPDMPAGTPQITQGFQVLSEKITEHRYPESSRNISRDGIVAWTNAIRREAGLAPLNDSPILDAIAKKRAADMVKTGYYGHDSKNGYGADDMSRYFRYRYLRYAENLAVGPFAGSRDAVRLWAESPSHLHNILSDRFHEIGAAVDEGWIEGKQRIVAVQVFGLPVWHCPEIDEDLADIITSEKVHHLEMERQARALRAVVSKSADPAEIAAYNDFITRMNYRASEIKRLTEEYNRQVQAFNECA